MVGLFPAGRGAGRRLRWRLALAALCLPGLVLADAPALAQDCQSAPVSTVDLTLAANFLPLVPVELDRSRRMLLVDTGSPASVLRENVVEALHLQRFPIPLDLVSGIGGRPFQERAVVHEVRIGQIHAPDLSYLVEPRSHAADPESDGLIGADEFSGFDVEFDFPGRKLTFYSRGCAPAFTGVSALAVLHMRLMPSAHILLPVELDGRQIDALLDTGASNSVLTLGAAHRLFGLDPQSPGVVRIGTIAGADGGTVDAYAKRFKQLTLGGIALGDPAIELMEDQTRRVHKIDPAGSGAGYEPEFMPDMILGMDQLRTLRLYIAYGRKLVYAGRMAAQ